MELPHSEVLGAFGDCLAPEHTQSPYLTTQKKKKKAYLKTY